MGYKIANTLLLIIGGLSFGHLVGIYLLEEDEPVHMTMHMTLDFVYEYDTTHLKLATTYNTEISQCDSTPNHTADGSYIDPIKLYNKEINWVALSRDQIFCEDRQGIFKDTTHWRGHWKFGDTIQVISENNPQIVGRWVVRDCKAASYDCSIDFLMDPRNNNPKLGRATDVKIVSKIKR